MVHNDSSSTLQLGNNLDSRILQKLYEFKMLGFHEVNEALVANSLGYRNPNNTVFAHSVRNLISQRLLQKNPMGHLGLSETALAVVRVLVNAPPPSSTNDWQQRAQTLMGGFLPAFFPTIWQKLCDGQSHTIDGLAASVGRSGGSQNLRSTIQAMKYLGLVEQVGKDTLKLSDIAFPYGRPY